MYRWRAMVFLSGKGVSRLTRIKCIVSYDGTEYSGWQVQPNARSVQGEIEKILTKMHAGNHTQIHGSGRTDKGVHAKGQVFHFDTHLPMDGYAWQRALNAQLPRDIFIVKAEQVAEHFHARYDVVAKQYSYMINNGERWDIFRRNHEMHYTYSLDFNQMELATKYFLGTHDFTSFCSTKSDKTDRVRTIYKLDMIREKDNRICFKVFGDGFLYNMVRIMVGTILDVGRGRFKPEEIEQMLIAKDRVLAGKTAPAHGLYLDYVVYDDATVFPQL